MYFHLKKLKTKKEIINNMKNIIISYTNFIIKTDKNKNNNNNSTTLIKKNNIINSFKKKYNYININIIYHKSKNSTKFTSIIIRFLLIIISLLINSYLTNDYSIILTINQTGYNKIFFNGYVDEYYPTVVIRPQRMLINKIGKDVSELYYLEERDNIIELIFDSSPDNIACLFYQCSNITRIDLSNFDTSSVTNMAHLFHGCSSLISVNLSGIITSSALHIDSMFQECSSLVSIDLSMLDTSNVVYMHLMFHQCSLLSSLDLSNFKTDKAVSMVYMFSGCTNLKYIDISNFDTSSVTDMEAMFKECSSLISLNLSHFNTKNVTNMKLMFNKLNLISLDLSNFNTAQVRNMNNMFSECDNLISLNLRNFNFSIIEDISGMFFDCPQLRYINLLNVIIDDNNLITSFLDHSLKNTIICTNDQSLTKIISYMECPLINYENWIENDEILIENINNKIIGNCVLSPTGEESCYEICSYKIYYNETINKYQCTKDEKCPETHMKLFRENNVCVKSCTATQENKYEYNNICLEECPLHFQELPQKPYYCFPSCPEDEPFLLIESLTCVLNCTISERQNKLCINGYIPKNIKDYNVFDKIIYQTKYELKNNFNESVVNGNPINENGAKIIITKTNNENNNDDVDINFGKCESELKSKYNISPNESLYLLRIDVEQEGMKVPSYEYELYYPINGQNLEKLDISLYCKGSKINITKNVNLTHDVKEHNASSNYYNDICYISDSNNAYDICLKDKQNNFVNKNMSICEITI